MTPRELLHAGRDVVGGKNPGMRGLWARAAALLTRQALEGGLAHLWRYRAPSLETANFTTQLLCLPQYISETELAHTVAHTWSALSGACHHRGYGMAPSAAELTTWQTTVEQLLDAVEAR